MKEETRTERIPEKDQSFRKQGRVGGRLALMRHVRCLYVNQEVRAERQLKHWLLYSGTKCSARSRIVMADEGRIPRTPMRKYFRHAFTRPSGSVRVSPLVSLRRPGLS